MDEARLQSIRNQSLALYGIAYEYPGQSETGEEAWFPLDPSRLKVIVGSGEKPGGRYREIHLRRTSRVKEGKTPFPFGLPLVPFVFIFPDRVVQAIKTSDKISLLLEAKGEPGTIILAPWPGQWRQDCFHLDDPDEALEALGYVDPAKAEPDLEVRGQGDAGISQEPGGEDRGAVQSSDPAPLEGSVPQQP